MLAAFDPLVTAQMALGGVSDLMFAVSFGALLLGFGGARRAVSIRVALLVWLVVQIAYLVLQASLMSGSPIGSALRAVPLVLSHSHYGVTWSIGVAAGLVALVLAVVAEGDEASGPLARSLSGAAFVVMAFAHAGATHAADAGDFSLAECVHALHLLMTGAWAGVVISAAWPLRHVFRPWSSETLRHLRRLSLLAMLTFAIAIATGLFNAWRGLGGSIAPLTTSLWGQLLVVKIVAVSVAVLIGAINRVAHLAHRNAIDRRTLAIFMRLLSFEAVLMIVVLAAASVLGHSMPAAVG